MSATDGSLSDGAAFPRLGPYVIVRTSGVGGMGRVDLALRTDGEPPDICVLKRMHGDARAPEQEARFEREARIAARLSHPNIAQTLRVEEIGGELCLAQEYVEGVDLARLMKQAGAKGVPVRASAHIVRAIAGALAYAHDFAGQEIVHRDVTPENIMLGFTGDVKLIDFGISRSGVDGTLTSVGMVIGRRAYLSPEAWSGSRPDRRADVFALGVVLWELLTARRLEELDEALWKECVPDPRAFQPEIPVEMAAIVMRALAPDPAQRFQSAGDLGDALFGFVPGDQDPRSELAALLAFYFNVERAKEIVAGQIEAARKTLRQSAAAGGKRRGSRTTWLSLAAVVLCLASGLAVWGTRPGGAVPTAASERERAAAPIAVPTPARSSVPATAAPIGIEPSTAVRVQPRETARRDPVAKRSKVVPAVVAEPAEKPEDTLRTAYDLFDAGRLTEAQAHARRAIGAGAGAQGHLLLGSILMNRGTFNDAERELETAVRLDPRNAEAARRLADVRRARMEQDQ